MKRILAVILLLVLLLCACSDNSVTQAPVSTKPAPGRQSASLGANGELIYEGSENKVLFENELCSLTLVKAEIDSQSDYCWYVVLVNRADHALNFSFDRTYVNDFDLDSLWAQRVEAGETVEASILWASPELQDRGITQVTRVDANLHISNAETGDLLVDQDITVYPSVKSAHITQSRASVTTDIAITDNDEFKILLIDFDEQTRWGKDLKVYVQNKTDNRVTVTMENVTVNDQPCDPLWRYTLDGGKQGYSHIVWFESVLEEAGAEGTLEFEYEFVVYSESGGVLARIPHTFVP